MLKRACEPCPSRNPFSCSDPARSARRPAGEIVYSADSVPTKIVPSESTAREQIFHSVGNARDETLASRLCSRERLAGGASQSIVGRRGHAQAPEHKVRPRLCAGGTAACTPRPKTPQRRARRQYAPVEMRGLQWLLQRAATASLRSRAVRRCPLKTPGIAPSSCNKIQ